MRSCHLGANQELQHRFYRAMAAVVLGCASVFGVLFVGEHARAESIRGAPASGTVFEAVKDGSSLEDALEAAGFITVDSTVAPEWLTEEVIDLNMVQECYAHPGFDVLFISLEHGPDESFERLFGFFEARGWWVATDNGEGMISLVKDEGVCRWMTASVMNEQDRWDVALCIKHDWNESGQQQGMGDGS